MIQNNTKELGNYINQNYMNNTYKRKYYKYKKKYLELKNKYEEYIPYVNSESLSQIKRTLAQHFEYCGNFRLKDKFLIIHGNPEYGNSKGKVCKYNYYSEFIWHTQPKVLKYYPEIENVLRVLKNIQTTYNYVFTHYGYWILYHKGVDKNWESEELLKYLTECNSKFYLNTDKGRKYNLKMIEEYISWLDNKFGLNNGFRIFWEPY